MSESVQEQGEQSSVTQEVEPFDGVAGEALISAGYAAVVSAPGGPLAMFGGALAGALQPFAARMAQHSINEFRQAQQRRDASVVIAVNASGLDPDDFANRITWDPYRSQLAGSVQEGAASSVYPARVIALGQALANGVVTDDDTVLDNEQQMVDAMCQLERPHIQTMMLFLDADHSKRYPEGWLRLVLNWEELCERGSGLKKSLPRLLAVLEREGLVARENVAVIGGNDGRPGNPGYNGVFWRITDFGIEALARLRNAGTGLEPAG